MELKLRKCFFSLKFNVRKLSLFCRLNTISGAAPTGRGRVSTGRGVCHGVVGVALWLLIRQNSFLYALSSRADFLLIDRNISKVSYLSSNNIVNDLSREHSFYFAQEVYVDFLTLPICMYKFLIFSYHIIK